MGQRAGDLFDFICDEFKRDKNGVKLDKSSNKKRHFLVHYCAMWKFSKREEESSNGIIYCKQNYNLWIVKTILHFDVQN